MRVWSSQILIYPRTNIKEKWWDRITKFKKIWNILICDILILWLSQNGQFILFQNYMCIYIYSVMIFLSRVKSCILLNFTCTKCTVLFLNNSNMYISAFLQIFQLLWLLISVKTDELSIIHVHSYVGFFFHWCLLISFSTHIIPIYLYRYILWKLFLKNSMYFYIICISVS